MLVLEAVNRLAPPPDMPSEQWLCENVVMPPGTETAGMPFSPEMFPHASAVCEAFDDRKVRRIILQWGTRLGKTTVCLSLMAFVAAIRCLNMMFSSTDKGAAQRVVVTRLYPIVENAADLGAQLPRKRSGLLVSFRGCKIFVGWSGSASSLADVGAWFGVGNEIDKWTKDKSSEADPLALFLNRFKGFKDHKIILESTPQIKGRSRIESALKNSRRHDRFVPCPHCGKFQILIKGDRKSRGGIKWETSASGHSDPDIAQQTAYYQCEHCLERIENHHRVDMMRAGVWVPEGCTIRDSGEIIGEPRRPDSDVVGFGPLPSWYSLIDSWGDFPKTWLPACKDPGMLQDVFNSYMAQTWERVSSETTWEQLGKRLIRNDQAPGEIPEWASLLTVGADKQEDRFVFSVEAWGPGHQSATIDYGDVETLEELRDQVIARKYAYRDGVQLAPAFTLIDSGFRPGGVYQFCRDCRQLRLVVWPCKGASVTLDATYRKSTLGKNTSDPGMILFLVDAPRTQGWVENQLHHVEPGEPGSASLFKGSHAEHQDFLEQLLNDAAIPNVDKANNVSEVWQRIDQDMPNDYRDSRRYAYVAMLARTRGAPIRPRGYVAPTEPQAAPRLTTHDGRPFLITER